MKATLLGIVICTLACGCQTFSSSDNPLENIEQIATGVKTIANVYLSYLEANNATEEQLAIPKKLIATADKYLELVARARETNNSAGLDLQDILQEVLNWQKTADLNLKSVQTQ